MRFPLKAAGLAATAARDPSREVMAAAFAILLCHYGELAADRRAIRNIISRVAKLGSSQDSGQISSHPQSCQGTQAHTRCGCASRQSRQGKTRTRCNGVCTADFILRRPRRCAARSPVHEQWLPHRHEGRQLVRPRHAFNTNVLKPGERRGRPSRALSMLQLRSSSPGSWRLLPMNLLPVFSIRLYAPMTLERGTTPRPRGLGV